MFTDRYRVQTSTIDAYRSTTKEIWDVNHGKTRPFYSDAKCRITIRDMPPRETMAIENGYVSKGWWGAIGPTYRNNGDPIGDSRRQEAARSALYQSICTGKEASGLLESAAEIGQTARMLTNPMGAIKLLRRLGSGGERTLKGAYLSWVRRTQASSRRRNIPAQLLNEASNLWLEKRYGWDPFIADLETVCVMSTGAAETVQAVRQKCAQPYVVSSGPISTTTNLETVTHVPNSALVYGDWRTYCTQSLTATYTSTLKARVRATCPAAYPSLEGMLHTLGLGVSVGYNLLPYSFVFDWFTDLGSRIERLGWRPAATFLGDNDGQGGIAYAIVLTKSESESWECYESRTSSNGRYTAKPLSGSRRGVITREWSRSSTQLQPSWTDQPLPSGWKGTNTISGVALIAQRALRDL